MGAHKNNPQAIAKAQRAPVPLTDEVYRYDVETVVEPNAAFMAEIEAAGDQATAAGGDTRRAVHFASQKFNPKDHPAQFDLVVYHRVMVGRPSALLPDPNKFPAALLRFGEVLRRPLAEVRERADQAFAMANEQGENLQ